MALILPLAVILGYFIVDPLEPRSLTVLGLVLAALALPLMMKWYHPLLICLWNAAMAPSFVPGSPQLWMLVALIGLLISVLNRSVNASHQFISVPGITGSLIFLTVVILVTAYFRGGIGSQIFGSSTFGGRRYFYTTLAVIGYFVLISQRIPSHRARWFVGLFFLSALTALVPDILGLAGVSITNILYLIFPPDPTSMIAETGRNFSDQFFRIYGLTLASTGLFLGLLTRYGIRGIFVPRKIWRWGLLLLAFVASLYCGFRSVLILQLLIFAAQFWLEGLHRTRLLAVFSGILLVGGTLVLTQAERLPLVMQRTISFLPLVPVSPLAKASADDSTEWRVGMWKVLLPEIPKYLLLGKGFSIDASEMFFSTDTNNRGNGAFYWAIVSGDYHSGPLSLVIPLGLWGVLGFGWFCVASLRYLHHQYLTGPPELRQVNTLLFAVFIGRLIFYLFVFGSFFSDFFLFTGIIGLSISLNGVVRQKSNQLEPQPVEEAEEELAELNRDRDNY